MSGFWFKDVHLYFLDFWLKTGSEGEDTLSPLKDLNRIYFVGSPGGLFSHGPVSQCMILRKSTDRA